MTERDKWGRIPVKLVEVDQEFCALRWNTGACFGGPSNNFMAFTNVVNDTDVWTRTIDVLTTTDPTILTNDFPLNNRFVFVNVGSFSLNPDLYSSLPVIKEEKTLTFLFRTSISSTEIHVDLCFLANDLLSTPEKLGFDIVLDPESVTNKDSRIGTVDVQPDPEGFGFYVAAEVLSSNVTSGAYSVFIEAEATVDPVGNDDIWGLQVTDNGVGRWKPTSAAIAEGNTAPCFNTLSSCQSLPTYLVKNSVYTLSVGQTEDVVQWGDLPAGFRNEGIYVEFYLWVTNFSGFDDDKFNEILDFGGKLQVGMYRQSLNNTFIQARYGTAEIKSNFNDTIGPNPDYCYKLAFFVSKAGELTGRYFSEKATGDPLENAAIDYVKITASAQSGSQNIADLKVYDYKVSALNLEPTLSEVARKGDFSGDAVFYAPLNPFTKYNTVSGAAPSENTFSETALSYSSILSGLEFYGLGPLDISALLEPPLTLRFGQRDKSTQLPETLGTIPSLIDASNKPAELQVGGTNENISALGSRDELMAQWEDHPYSDILTDPYRDQRTYDPESQGTFWGKWLARNVYKQGFAMRYVSGYELPGGGLERTHTYNYILEKVNGPTNTGKVTAQGYDILQSLRADRAVFPSANTGRLSADISDTATAFTLEPVGVGDEEYPSSGTFRVRIGGEGFDVTRSGDDFTVVTRGLYGGAESHSAEDVVQEVAQLSDQIHDVAYTIITGALPELAGNIPKAKWDGLADDFLPRIYTADITEPTGVEDLLSELVATAPIYFYADVRTNLIELGVIREPSGVAIPLREGQELIADSVNLKEYPKERIDEVWVYYRIRDAAGDIEDEENYSQRFILVNPTEQQRRGRRSIRRIYTRWIEASARDTAEEIAQAYISRFQNQPIRVSFDLDAKHGDIWLGDVAALVSRQKQTVTGEKREDLNYQVIRAQESSQGHKFTYIAQSYEFFAPIDPDSITITIQPEDNLADDGTVDQIDLRELYDATVATEIPTITFVVAGGPLPSGGTVVGAGTGQTWSLRNPNSWPWSPDIELRIEPGGVIAGRGGTGGDGGSVPSPNGTDGTDGQTGFLCQYATNVNNLGIIGGGGGGAGGGGVVFTGTGTDNNRVFAGGGGGGGAGKTSVGGVRSTRSRNIGNPPSSDSENGEPGTPTTGGAGGIGTFGARSGGTPESGGGNGGNGGGLGQAGQPGSDGDGGLIPEGGATEGTGGAGGAPGNAVDGVSFITYITEGDIRGNQV